MLVVPAGACGPSAEPAPGVSVPQAGSTAPEIRVNPGRIKRVGAEFPPGYEVTAVAGLSSPARIWGLGPGATTTPAQCSALADPVAAPDGPAQGVSGSGPGGIASAVVVASATGPLALDAARVARCGHWTAQDGRTTGRVQLIEAPRIDGVATIAMAGDIRTIVEGGTEFNSRTQTFVAYLGRYCAFTTLVTDPGSSYPALDPAFAADLLVKTVSALRS